MKAFCMMAALAAMTRHVAAGTRGRRQGHCLYGRAVRGHRGQDRAGLREEDGHQGELVKAGAGELDDRLKAEKGRQDGRRDLVGRRRHPAGQPRSARHLYPWQIADKVFPEVKPTGKWTPFTLIATSFIINTSMLAPLTGRVTCRTLANPGRQEQISSPVSTNPPRPTSSWRRWRSRDLSKGWDLYSRILDNT